jgi:hypothetical protein
VRRSAARLYSVHSPGPSVHRDPARQATEASKQT